MNAEQYPKHTDVRPDETGQTDTETTTAPQPASEQDDVIREDPEDIDHPADSRI